MKNKLKVIAYTVGRSDFERFLPILNILKGKKNVKLEIVPSYIHYLSFFGSTIQNIKKKFSVVSSPNYKNTSFNLQDNPKYLASMVSSEIKKISDIFKKKRPDLIFILGDRFEMISAPIAALPFNIPVIHLYGGAITEGAIDDSIRHSITKLSHFHLVAHSEYKKRINQLGEENWRIVNIGIPEINLMKKQKKMSKYEISKITGLDFSKKTMLVTFHPVTKEPKLIKKHVKILSNVLKKTNMQAILTYPNSDSGFKEIVREYKFLNQKLKNITIIKNAGLKLYTNLMMHCSLMLGNSSSGIVEATSFKLPVINIGNRQEGKVKPDNVIDCKFNELSINQALNFALSKKFNRKISNIKNPYDKKINLTKVLNQVFKLSKKKTFLNKKFYDHFRR